MKSFNSILIIGTIGLLSVACTPAQNDVREPIPDEPGALDIILCEEPRPQICTKEYDPVCATLDDGSTRTGATGCTSCSDPKVVSYTKGACGIVSVSPE